MLGSSSGSGSGSGSDFGSGMSLGSIPPSILSPSQSITAIVGAILFINLQYDSGNPRGFLVWRFNGDIISNRTDPRVTILREGGLIIRDVVPEDEGTYNVTVANEVGSDSRIFNVAVEQCEFGISVLMFSPVVYRLKGEHLTWP